ncbi:MAG: acyl-CoA dehydratase activase [Oscillospiraceae bacterium]
MLGLGIDSGSTTTKAVLFDGTKIIQQKLIPTSANPKESINRIYDELYSDEVGYTVATGYGRELLERADKQVTEITCHARGAAFLNPNARAVIDIGGQDCKAILLDNDLNVIDFLMNDKCAAGTGRFIDMMMRILEEDINNIDEFVKDRTPANITSMCTVFAESEIISLLAKGVDRGDIALGIINSICRRTSFFAQKLNINGEIFFSGGLAKFEAFRKTLEENLSIKVTTSELSQFAGAIGAASIAYLKCKKAPTL